MNRRSVFSFARNGALFVPDEPEAPKGRAMVGYSRRSFLGFLGAAAVAPVLPVGGGYPKPAHGMVFYDLAVEGSDRCIAALLSYASYGTPLVDGWVINAVFPLVGAADREAMEEQFRVRLHDYKQIGMNR